MSFVLVHGAGFGADCWDEVIPHLGADALAVDLPGRGARAGTDLRSVTLAGCADAIRADLEERDLRDVILVGHSFAGVTVPALTRADVQSLDTGHMAMISAPKDLAGLLNAIHG